MSSAITELVFRDDVPPDLPPDESPNLTGSPDAQPEMDSLACQVCGKGLTYAGRGRKPKFCDEHKSNKSGTGTTRKSSVTGNERLANQATEALVQLNRMTGLGLRLIGMPHTGEMIAFCEEGFREQAYAALLTDPALCKQLLSVGGFSGKTALIIAYGMMGAQMAPVANHEIRQMILARKERNGADFGTDN